MDGGIRMDDLFLLTPMSLIRIEAQCLSIGPSFIPSISISSVQVYYYLEAFQTIDVVFLLFFFIKNAFFKVFLFLQRFLFYNGDFFILLNPLNSYLTC